VNPSVTGIHLVPKIYEAQRRGARLVVVDPRATPLARRADLHLPVRPGSDLGVALAVIDRLFATGRADAGFLDTHATGADRLREAARPWTMRRAADAAGVAEEDLERFAELYAEARPAVIRCGWGLERNRHGGSAAAAILALPAVAGKFGVRGGGYTLSNSSAWKFESAATSGVPEASTRVRAEPWPCTRTRIRPRFGFSSSTTQCAATAPRQEKVRAGLSRDDLFTVLFDRS
jgi:anaerobic selenocysteine-containing dehydrogenase